MSSLQAEHSSQELMVHQHRLYRLVEEALDFSLLVCNTDLEEFTIAKVFDLINEILPTAFVVDTGFWPLYVNNFDYNICVCGQYGIPCRHSRRTYHCLDILEYPIVGPSEKFCTKTYGHLVPTWYLINIRASNTASPGYTVNIQLRLEHQKPVARAKKYKDILDINQRVYKFSFTTRYRLSQEFYSSNRAFNFCPHPRFLNQYGSYLKNLTEVRSKHRRENSLDGPNSYLRIHPKQRPTFTLVFHSSDSPLYRFPLEINLIHPPSLRKTKRGRKPRQVSDVPISNLLALPPPPPPPRLDLTQRVQNTSCIPYRNPNSLQYIGNAWSNCTPSSNSDHTYYFSGNAPDPNIPYIDLTGFSLNEFASNLAESNIREMAEPEKKKFCPIKALEEYSSVTIKQESSATKLLNPFALQEEVSALEIKQEYPYFQTCMPSTSTSQSDQMNHLQTNDNFLNNIIDADWESELQALTQITAIDYRTNLGEDFSQQNFF